MGRRFNHFVKHLLLAAGYGLAGAAVLAVGGYVYLLESRPDLKVWHTARLDAEFSAERSEAVTTLDAYLDVEDGVMRQLHRRVYDRIAAEDRRLLVRYHRGSLMDPESSPTNWNRSFELAPPRPVAAALLLHGLSDSPYSMRAIGQSLHDHGVLSLGLRLPGHGTAPAGLLDVSWQDFVAAVRLAAADLKRRVGDAPVFIVGYSNGAALAVEHALSPLEGSKVPRVDALVLLSPAIGVSPVAALAKWQGRLGHVAGLSKLAWNSIEPEFDPYKYNSFAVNAGDQIHQLTSGIERRINALAASRALDGFPPTLAFQSVVDATITARALVDRLFLNLDEGGGHELVIFDVNRNSETEPLLKADPETFVRSLLESPALPFDLTLVTNADETTATVVARVKRAGSPSVADQPLALAWPAKVFSLSHVALPFPPDDPLYGASPAPDDGRITLGSVHIQGERNLLQIPDNYFIRLRHNPFYVYMIERIVRFLRLGERSRAG